MQTLYERLLKGVVAVLYNGPRETERDFIEAFRKIDEEMADEIEKRLFVFEHVVNLDDRAVQKMLREVDTEELAKALRGASAEVQDKIFRNMSKRAVELLKEEMEYMGPVRAKDVEEMQQKIGSIIRKLESQGEIVVPATDGEELIV